jgi:hypothetical protein
MATTNSKIAAAKKLATKVKAKGKKKDYSPQNPPQSKVYREVNDEQVSAKPVGWRWTTKGANKVGANPDSRPSSADVEKYKGKTFKVKGVSNRYVYQEKRVDKSDKSRKNKFQEGGTLGAGSFKDGGKVKQTTPQSDVYKRSNDKKVPAKPVGWRYRGAGARAYEKPSEKNIQRQLKLSPDDRTIYFERRKDKSDYDATSKLENGGTLGAGSFKKGGATFGGRQYDPYREDIDLELTAKPVGYRYTDRLSKRLGVSAYARPTKEHIEKYLGRGVYREMREDKADLRPTTSKTKASLQEGGTLGAGSFARGGKTSYRPQYVRNEDIASITLKSGKVIKNDSIYDGAYVSKSLKLQDGGTLGAGSFQDGGTLGAGSFARGGVERIANTQAREYTENLIPFKGNNLEGKTLDNGDYVVLSYGYYPIWWYCKKQGKWYGNSTKYSVTTSKQMSQSRPTYDATMLSRNDLTDMMMKHNSSYEDGGLLDNILSDTSVDGTQSVGGTTFSQGSLTPDMDITNPNF